jgi:hypothetical protein
LQAELFDRDAPIQPLWTEKLMPPAMRNGRCRIHGGKSPGAPRGGRNGRWRGGFYTAEAQADRRRLRDLIRQMRATMDELP